MNIDNMRKVLKQIFRPNDGSARAVQFAVNETTRRSVIASNSLIDTVSELLERNDRITGRKPRNAKGNN